METHREVKSVWRQSSTVHGDYRLRSIEHVLGKKTTETVHREYGCIYKTDLKEAYFSPRLSYERIRIAKLVQAREVVLNMFAGVGCYSIAIVKHSNPLKVYSIDVNPHAVKYQHENVRLNRAETKVLPIHGDAKTVIENRLQNAADRVIMPLPEKAFDYLEYATLALKPRGGWIHYYSFEHANKNEDPVRKAERKVSGKLSKLGKEFAVEFSRIVRTIGPRWFQIVLDIKVNK